MKGFWIQRIVRWVGFWSPTLLLAAGEPSGNLLANGDVEAMEPLWPFHTEQDAKATFAVERDNGNAVGHAIVTQVGKRNHVQLACPLPQASLASGEIQRVTLRWRAVRGSC